MLISDDNVWEIIGSRVFEAIVEANTLLSGIGFESGGLSVAHAIHNGFSALKGDIYQLSHGEKIAYTTFGQLMLENAKAEEFDQYIQLYQRLQLPTTLKGNHLDQATDAELLQIGRQSVISNEIIHHLPFPVTPEDIVGALKASRLICNKPFFRINDF